MKHSEFKIGMEFLMSGLRWRVTDIGTRCVVAIHLNPRYPKDWFNGPPYAVCEDVIDEDDMPACEVAK